MLANVYRDFSVYDIYYLISFLTVSLFFASVIVILHLSILQLNISIDALY